MRKIDYEKTSKETIQRMNRMISKIVEAIENEPECTYEDAMHVLECVKNNYQKKGSDLLNSVDIQKVAEFRGLLH